MTDRRKWAVLTIAILCGFAAASYAIPAQVSSDSSRSKPAEQSRVAFSGVLPKMDGGRIQASMVEVVYGPGGSSVSHSHPCPVIVYVVEGALRTQVKGQPESIYKTGETFYEEPNGVHLVSANASDREPVKFLAYFVCDHDTPLSVAAPGAGPSGGKQP